MPDQKSYGDNDALRLEPADAQRRDLAPPGMVGTRMSRYLQSANQNQQSQADVLAVKLRDERKRSAENRRGMHGEIDGPFIARRDFYKARDPAADHEWHQNKVDQLAERLRRQRAEKQRSAENRQGIHGERGGPFMAKRDFSQKR